MARMSSAMRAGQRTLVEHVGTVLGDGAQGAGEVGHGQALHRIGIDRRGRHRRIALGQEAGAGAGIAGEVRHRRGDLQRRVPVDDRSRPPRAPTAGATRSRHGLRPKRRCAAASPAGCVGATTALAPTVLTLPTTIGQPNRLPSSRLSVSTKSAGIERLRRAGAEIEADGLARGRLVARASPRRRRCRSSRARPRRPRRRRPRPHRPRAPRPSARARRPPTPSGSASRRCRRASGRRVCAPIGAATGWAKGRRRVWARRSAFCFLRGLAG